MIWGQYLIYDQTSFDALGLSWNISIKFFIFSILSLPEELIFFLLYSSVFKSVRKHAKRIQYYKQNIISLEGRCTPYPLPTSLCFFDSLSLSLFFSVRSVLHRASLYSSSLPSNWWTFSLSFLRYHHTLV